MFRKQDFKKVDLLGSGKKNTKIYKALHLATVKYYALKEVEAKTLDKLNEYKVFYFHFHSYPIGRSSSTVQGLEPSQHHLILRLLLLRDYV